MAKNLGLELEAKYNPSGSLSLLTAVGKGQEKRRLTLLFLG